MVLGLMWKLSYGHRMESILLHKVTAIECWINKSAMKNSISFYVYISGRSPDSRRIALGYLSLWSAAVLVWDTKISKNPLSLLRKQTILRFLGGSENSIFYKVASLAWSPDGRYIASGGEDRTLLVLDPLKYF